MAINTTIITVYAFLAGGIACFLILGSFSGKTKWVGTVLGYSMISTAILMLIISTQLGDNSKTSELLYKCYPLWLMLMVSGSMLKLNISYTDVIKKNNVPPNYFHYNNTIVCLLFLQFYLLLKNPEPTPTTNISVAGLALLQLLIVGFVLYVILRYYTTDG